MNKKQESNNMIIRPRKRRSKKDIRRDELISALHARGLELRNDSRLCEEYINSGNEDINYVVKRMCEMKYLHEYIDFNHYYDLAYDEHKDLLKAGFYPDCTVFEEAEEMALKSVGGYPTVFPWFDPNEKYPGTKEANARKIKIDHHKAELNKAFSEHLKNVIEELNKIPITDDHNDSFDKINDENNKEYEILKNEIFKSTNDTINNPTTVIKKKRIAPRNGRYRKNSKNAKPRIT